MPLLSCACAAASKPRRSAVSRTSPLEFLLIDLASAWNSRSLAISCSQFAQAAPA